MAGFARLLTSHLQVNAAFCRTSLPLIVERTVTNVTTLDFTDQSSGGTGVFIVDVGTEGIRVCLSLRDDGDAEAVLSQADAQRVVHALTEAVRRAAPARG